MNLMNVLTTLAVLAVLAGAVILQFYLSGRENKYIGLILPALTFAGSFAVPLNLAAPAEGITVGFLGNFNPRSPRGERLQIYPNRFLTAIIYSSILPDITLQ